MATRVIDFVTGFTTSTAPTTSNPTNNEDAVSKGYADSTYTFKSDVYGSVTDVAAAKAIGPSDRADEQILWISSKATFYEFDAGSSAVGDDDLIIQPNSGTGRWIKQLASASGGASTGAAGIEALEQKCFGEHFGVVTPEFTNSLCESFSVTPPDVQLWLMEDYVAPATQIAAVVNPKWLDTANKNFDGVAGWTAFSAEVTNIHTEATTKKLGTNALSFDKSAGTSTIAGVYKDLTVAGSLNLGAHTEVWMYVNMPSVTNFSSFKLRIAGTGETTVGTNYREYTVTTNSAGGAIASGWNLIKFDIALGQGTAFGTGYTVADLARVFGFFVITSSAAQTYTNVIVDSWVFNLTDYALYLQPGDTLQIYDTSNEQILQVDNSNSAARGYITLTAALADNYSGGTAATIKRSNLDHTAINVGRMQDGLSGEIADKQTFIKKVILPATLTAADFDMSVSQYSDLFHTVTDVDSTSQIKVQHSSGTDYSAQFLSGDKYMVFEVIKAQGKIYYSYRGLKLTLSANSTFGSSKLTLQNSGSNSGVVVGDLIVKEEVDTYLSFVANSADESYGSALSQTSILLSDIGNPYPGLQYVYGHWRLGGNLGLYNLQGQGATLSQNGGPTNRSQAFKNGFFGAGPFTAAQERFHLATGTADELLGDAALGFSTYSISLWFYPISAPGAAQVIVAHDNGTIIGSSWVYYFENTGAITIRRSGNNTLGTIAAGTIPTGSWHHIAVVWEDDVEMRFYVNGVKNIGTAPAHGGDATNSQFCIGGPLTASATLQLANGYLADVIAWAGYKLTDSDVAAIYGGGNRGGLTGRVNSLRHRYEKTSLTGNKLTARVDLKRWTDAVDPQIDFVGAIKK